MSEAQRLEAAEVFQKLQPMGFTLREAVDYFIDHVKPKGSSRTLTEVAAELVERKQKKNFKPRYVKALRIAYSVFNRTFGTRLVNTLTQAEIDQWLDAQPYKATTKRNYIRDLGILFRYAVEQGDCPVNVIGKIELPMVDEPLPSILDVETISSLMSVARKNPRQRMLAGLAVGFFAGLRSCELEKLTWDEIHLDDAYIEVKAEKSKTRKRRLVDVSPNLSALLKHHPRRGGVVLPKNWRQRLKALMPKAGIKNWPKNCMRHSFASYHLAEKQSAALTALQLGHANTDMLFRHYRELVRGADASRYWKILPPTAQINTAPAPTATDV